MLSYRSLVLVDADGVLADFDGAILREANSLTGMNWTVEDVRTWEVFDSISHADFPNLMEVCHEIANRPGWCLAIEPYLEAFEAMAKLQKIADVLIVTAPFRGVTWEGERRQWFEKHFGIKKDHIIQAKAKWAVHGDFLIDDKPENVLSWARYARCGGEGFLWDPRNKYPDFRNRRVGYPPSYRRVTSWKEVLELISVAGLVREKVLLGG